MIQQPNPLDDNVSVLYQLLIKGSEEWTHARFFFCLDDAAVAALNWQRQGHMPPAWRYKIRRHVVYPGDTVLTSEMVE